MVLSDEKKKEYVKRLLMSRMRLLINNGFYGLLLMHMIYSVDESCETTATDGRRMFFNPKFLDELSDTELDFVMMHEILHVVLQHCLRREDRDKERFDLACDIVVNSNILLSNNMDVNSITLKKYGQSPHIAPNGKEGYEYTAEQIYRMLQPLTKNGNPDPGLAGLSNSPGEMRDDNREENKNNSAPEQGKSNSREGDGNNNARRQAEYGGNGKNRKGSAPGQAKQKQSKKTDAPACWDDHSRWGKEEEEEDAVRDVWVKRFEDACEAISIRDPSNQRGLLPLFAERLLKELRKPQTDWRVILNDFIQEEIMDYSFTPPDRRFDESPFFLPDFNDKDDRVEDILFMIDTSGSMSDDMITAAYSEVKGAIDQFDGKLKGWLGFFDAAIIEPKPFTSPDEFKIIKSAGGGGTDFQIIFEYVHKHMQDKLPASIIILTDGFAPFPQEKLSMGIPVLWLLNNEEVNPPWGKVARITV